jgi:hypothetical protein
VHDLYRKLIAIRGAHRGLSAPHFYPGGWHDDGTLPDPHGFGIDRGRNVIVYHRWTQDDAGAVTARYYVALNFSNETRHVSFEAPDAGPWDDLLGGPTLPADHGRVEFDLGSNWGAIYYRAYP